MAAIVATSNAIVAVARKEERVHAECNLNIEASPANPFEYRPVYAQPEVSAWAAAVKVVFFKTKVQRPKTIRSPIGSMLLYPGSEGANTEAESEVAFHPPPSLVRFSW
jgi:hypothetical protein